MGLFDYLRNRFTPQHRSHKDQNERDATSTTEGPGYYVFNMPPSYRYSVDEPHLDEKDQMFIKAFHNDFEPAFKQFEDIFSHINNTFQELDTIFAGFGKFDVPFKSNIFLEGFNDDGNQKSCSPRDDMLKHDDLPLGQPSYSFQPLLPALDHEKKDTDLDSTKVKSGDMDRILNGFAENSGGSTPKVFSHSKSVVIRKRLLPDGSFEESRETRDSRGNYDFVVTQHIGDKEKVLSSTKIDAQHIEHARSTLPPLDDKRVESTLNLPTFIENNHSIGELTKQTDLSLYQKLFGRK